VSDDPFFFWLPRLPFLFSSEVEHLAVRPKADALPTLNLLPRPHKIPSVHFPVASGAHRPSFLYGVTLSNLRWAFSFLQLLCTGSFCFFLSADFLNTLVVTQPCVLLRLVTYHYVPLPGGIAIHLPPPFSDPPPSPFVVVLAPSPGPEDLHKDRRSDAFPLVSDRCSPVRVSNDCSPFSPPFLCCD